MKRSLDVVVSLVAIVALSPLLIASALAVWMRFGHPILFTQIRPGFKGIPFRIFKFRTMLEAEDSDGSPERDEERLTPFGRFLRRTSLDELPELFNVLQGDMSLVGPRPLLPQYLPRYTAEQARRHDVKPGITGWAQVNGRNELTWPEKLQHDVWYVDHQSLLLDCWILCRTLWTLVTRRGISQPGHATAEEFKGEAIS